MNFQDLKLKSSVQQTELTLQNEEHIKVKSTIPVSDVIDLIQIALQKSEENGIYNEIKNVEVGDLGNYYNKYTTLTGLDLDDIQISQSFAYPDDRIYSNADVIEHTGGMTWLNWDLNNKDEGFKMIIYKIGIMVF